MTAKIRADKAYNPEKKVLKPEGLRISFAWTMTKLYLVDDRHNVMDACLLYCDPMQHKLEEEYKICCTKLKFTDLKS
jgi:sugar (pentulose or hexulose) kinase